MADQYEPLDAAGANAQHLHMGRVRNARRPLTAAQKEYLEKYFSTNLKMTTDAYAEVSAATGLNKDKVRKWYDNRRRKDRLAHFRAVEKLKGSDELAIQFPFGKIPNWKKKLIAKDASRTPEARPRKKMRTDLSEGIDLVGEITDGAAQAFKILSWFLNHPAPENLKVWASEGARLVSAIAADEKRAQRSMVRGSKEFQALNDFDLTEKAAKYIAKNWNIDYEVGVQRLPSSDFSAEYSSANLIYLLRLLYKAGHGDVVRQHLVHMATQTGGDGSKRVSAVTLGTIMFALSEVEVSASSAISTLRSLVGMFGRVPLTGTRSWNNPSRYIGRQVKVENGKMTVTEVITRNNEFVFKLRQGDQQLNINQIELEDSLIPLNTAEVKRRRNAGAYRMRSSVLAPPENNSSNLASVFASI